MPAITLPSGCQVEDPGSRLLAFCREEYAYYDAIPSADPNRVEPVDVLATVSVNSFLTNATAIRNVHRGLSSGCDQILELIPEDADLLAEDIQLGDVRTLLHAAVQARGVLVPVATKVLHRKRPMLIPILDNVVLAHYLGTTPSRLPAKTQDAHRAADAAIEVLARFRTDLRAVRPEIEALESFLATHGYRLSLVRILEILLWTQVEQQGYYR